MHLRTLSDTLYECDTEIRRHQRENPVAYGEFKPRLDAIRAQVIAIRLELDRYPDDPPEWLACNPYYVAALAGDPSPSDAYMNGDDSLHKAWLRQVAKLRKDTEL